MRKGLHNVTLTKSFILNKIDQISIFSVYLDIPETIIYNCINTGELITSPLRYDNNPTCGFKYDNRGKLKFRDFAGFIWGDCFDIVGFVISKMYNTDFNVSDKKHFYKILQHISYTFKHIIYGEEIDVNIKAGIDLGLAKIRNSKNIIEFVVRSWNTEDIKFWNKYGIDLGWLNINFIYPVDQYYINIKTNPKSKYYYDKKDPCYAYMLGRDQQGLNNIKLYFPNRKKGNVRFITNSNVLEGSYGLVKKDYDYIIITKSTKDRICLSKHLAECVTLYGESFPSIGVINIPAENYKLSTLEYMWLKEKIKNFKSANLLSLMDNDRVGKLESIWLKKEFSITPLLIPKNFEVKDFSEFREKYGKSKTINFIKSTIDENTRTENLEYIWNENETSIEPF